MVLIIGQLGKLLGLSISASDPLHQLWEVIRELGNISGITVAVSAVALTALLLLRFAMPRLPTALLAVAAAIAVSWALGLQRSRNDPCICGWQGTSTRPPGRRTR